MSLYFLFRGDILVDKSDTSASIGAVNLHSLGQPGDLLVCIEHSRLMRFAGYSGSDDGQELFWIPMVTSIKTEAKYRMLILLQT